MNRDKLVRALIQFLELAIGPNRIDDETVLSPVGLQLASRLAEIAAPGDARAWYFIGVLRLSRYRVLSQGQNEDDRQATLDAFGRVAAIDATMIDETLRTLLADLEPPVRWAAEAARILNDQRLAADPVALDEAVRLLTNAVRDTPADHPDLAMYLSNLGGALQIRLRRTGEMADLEEAVRVTRAAVDATSDGQADRDAMMSNLGGALLARFERIGDEADLHEAIRLIAYAAQTIPADHPDLGSRQSNLCGALQQLFWRTGLRADVDEAVRAGQAAVRATPHGHTHLAERLSTLGNALRARFTLTGKIADLNEATQLLTNAMRATEPDDPAWPRYLSNLGNVLRIRFEHTGDVADLDEAVRVGQEAALATPADHPNRSGYLSNLGYALRIRFEHKGAEADLDESIRLLRDAVQALAPDHYDRVLRLSDLGTSLKARFGRTGAMADSDEAIRLLTTVVEATPKDDPDLAMHLSNLGAAFQVRFARTRELDDSDQAIRQLTHAVQVTPDDQPNLAMYLGNLSDAFHTRFGRTSAEADLDKAVGAGQKAVLVTPDGHPGLARRLLNLGNVLQTRFERTGVVADQAAAVKMVMRGAATVSAGPALRTQCGRSWIRWAGRAGDWAAAREGTDAVLQLLPQLVDHGLNADDRRHRLKQLQGLAAPAAWSVLDGGRATDPQTVVQAWSVLEATRGVLLGQALETREDISELAESHPALAQHVLRLRAALNNDVHPARAPHQLTDSPLPHTARADEGPDALTGFGASRIQAAREWTELLATIRALPGFERFGLPPSMEQMRSAAADGTIVAVLVTAQGCGALLLARDQAGFLPLPQVSEPEIIKRTNRFLAATHQHIDAPDVAEITETLGWLWDTVAQPILDHLGHTAPLVDSPTWPRIWWMPTGAMSLLPLHAAGRHEQPGQSVLDRVVSSYTPTVRALWHIRHQAPKSKADALVVGVNHSMLRDQNGDTLPPLRFAEPEARDVHLQLATTSPPLLATAATHDTVISTLPTVRWAHLACHAYADHQRPGDSYLALYDKALRIRDVSELDLSGGHLAVLSACTTATAALDNLDEPIHLASAFQIAGFTHTIATLWPISDPVAPWITNDLYHHLTTGTPPAQAIHNTTRMLRANPDTRSAPYLWASHVHFGP